MVDNRSAGFFGIGGAFNFKSGDISGTAARTQDDKMGQGGEYFAQQQREEEEMERKDEKYMDRSAILRATLNSLAMMNVANVINTKKQSVNSDEKKQFEELRNTLENQQKKENPHHDNPQDKKEKIKQQLIEEEELLEEQIEKEYNDFIDFDK
ncbi:hypothetical protein J6E39_04115 [bacterium]|nr:hypothetical protein [bacterium]